MPDELTLQVKTTLSAIQSAHETASEWLSGRGVPAEGEYLANLAIEELVTNTMKYGHDDQNEHVVEIKLALEDGELVLTVTDDGHPFDPLSWPEPETRLPIEDLPIGGLGIHLLRQIADSMQYARVGDKNRLTLRKMLPAGA
jgi:anti-sigma regulatory factor (Ser/Thr protein kinase)